MNGREVADQLVGAEVIAGMSVIGAVEGVVRDPVSGRVRRLVIRYGTVSSRQVAVPIEWVARHQARRIVLAVETRSLDQLADYDGASRIYRAAPPPAVSGGTPDQYVSATGQAWLSPA
jgi:hypothetical protein